MEKTLHTFDEAVRRLHDRINLERLQSFAPQDMEGRLDLLRQVLTSLGNPEIAYRTVHVTGTKGKGSTCVMLESILLESGYRVGRFTSPHLYSFTERLMIDGIACPLDEFTELFFSVYEQIEPDTLQSFTYFELLTLLAFVYFARKKVDVAIFEVGLGGRLDATNVCQPDVSVITSISYDHTAQLGPTLSDIAAEKSGIIKPGVPVVTTVRHPESLTVIRKKAQSLGSRLFVFDEHFFVRKKIMLAPGVIDITPLQGEKCQFNGVEQYAFRYDARLPDFPVELSLDDISPKMPGTHQIVNASAAISTFLLLHRDEKTFDAETIRFGIQNAFMPLRFEIIAGEGLPTFIFDGAHNRASMQVFVQTALAMFPSRRLLLIFGASLGKDVEGMFAEIDGHFAHIFLTQSSDSNRRFPPQELRSICALPDANVSTVENCIDACERSVQAAKKEDVICITGSLYLAAELRKRIVSFPTSPRKSGGR
jgi:dihydrofolate synthase/folylpolyglutamate synthase